MRASSFTSFGLAAVLSLAACGSDKTEVETPGNASKERICDAPKTDGKPAVRLPADPASKLGIKDDKVGNGTAIVEHDTVTVNYVGCGQISGKQFDSSWDSGEPAEFSIDQVIPGWTQGLLGMKVGGRRTLTIPSDLAYGANPTSPDIKANETLVFVVDLVSIKAPPAPDDPAVVKAITDRGKPTVTVPDAPVTALKVVDDIVGTGTAIGPASTVKVHYVGVGQISKKQFDASWDRGEPAEFSVTGVIKGWTQGLQGMKVGGRRTLTIPGALAYGPEGNPPDIQPDETLVFVVDLIAVS